VSQAGPGNDINAGSPGSLKAPTQIPASLVQPLARALWRRLPHPNPESDPQKAEAPERRQRVAIKARIGYDVAHIRRLDFDRGGKDR
jgi:hypothetical protein